MDIHKAQAPVLRSEFPMFAATTYMILASIGEPPPASNHVHLKDGFALHLHMNDAQGQPGSASGIEDFSFNVLCCFQYGRFHQYNHLSCVAQSMVLSFVSSVITSSSKVIGRSSAAEKADTFRKFPATNMFSAQAEGNGFLLIKSSDQCFQR